MTLSLYPVLSAGLTSLSDRYRSIRSSQHLPSHADVDLEDLPQLPGGNEQVRKDVQALWDGVTGTGGMDEEIVRAEIELAGRQLVLDTAYEEPSFSAPLHEKVLFLLSLSDALDITLTQFEIALSSSLLSPSGSGDGSDLKPSASTDAGTIFIPILEELVDLLSVETWAGLFGWLESRSRRFTADLLPSKGKSLPLLKLLNTLLRSISKTSSSIYPSSSSSSTSPTAPTSPPPTTNLELRARIHIFASETFSLSDPSGVNLRGEYWAEDWRKLREREKAVGVRSGTEAGAISNVEAGEGNGGAKKEEGGDVKMDSGDEGKREESEEGERKEGEDLDQQTKILHAALSSLQAYFSNPPSIVPSTPHATALFATLSENGFPPKSAEETPLQVFKRIVAIVIPALGEWGKKGKEGGEKGVTVDGEQGEREGEYPHFLMSSELLQSQLQSPSFRRQILVQLLIFLQIVRGQDAREKLKLPKDIQFSAAFSTSQEDVEWAREKVIEVKDCLVADEKGGKEFNAMISMVLSRETHHATWKHLSCKPFEKPSQPEADILLADRQRRAFLAPLKPYKFAAGTAALTANNRDPLTSVEQLMDFEIPSTVESLKVEYDREIQDEEDAKAMGRADEKRLGPWVEEKASLSWRALRLVMDSDLGIFSEVGATGDVATLSKALAKRKADTSASDEGAGGVAMSRNASGESGSGQGRTPAVDAEEATVETSESSSAKDGSHEKQDPTSPAPGDDVKMEVDDNGSSETPEQKAPEQGDVVME